MSTLPAPLQRSLISSEGPTNHLTTSDDILHLLPILPSGLFTHTPERPTQSHLPVSRSEASIRVKHLAWARCLSRSVAGSGNDSQPAVGTVSGLEPDSRIQDLGALYRTSSSSSVIRQSQSLSALAQHEQTQSSKRVSNKEDLEESPKFKLRRNRIREMERLQELEDERDANKHDSLHALCNLLNSHPFSNISATFEDLDGQGHMWNQCSIRRAMKDDWDSRSLDVSSALSSDSQLSLLGGRSHPRSVHALYADLSAQTEDRASHLDHPSYSSASSDINASISLPVIPGRRSIFRTSIGRTVRQRASALSRRPSLSRSVSRIGTKEMPYCPRSRTAPGDFVTRAEHTQADGGTQCEGPITGSSSVLHGLALSYKSDNSSERDSHWVPLTTTSTEGRLASDKDKQRTCTLPRMTRTISSATSDSYGFPKTRNTALSAHAKRLAQVKALRAEDSDEEVDAPLMMRARSSAGSSSSSSFGLKPLKTKRVVIRPKTRINGKLCRKRENPLREEEEDIDIKELERIMLRDDPTMIWADNANAHEEAAMFLPPPPPSGAHGAATWGGVRASHAFGSTISRASGRGKHAMRRAPLPFASAMEKYLADPNPDSLTPLTEVLRD